MFGKCYAPAIAVALFAGSTSAHATTVDVRYQVPDSPFGTQNLQQTVTISTPNDPAFNEGGLYDGDATAGTFQMNGGTELGNFAAYCVELAQALQSSATYEIMPNLFAGRILSNIDRLFSSAYGGVDTALEASAFQVALWEIVHDDAETLDLGSGNVIISGNDAVTGLASNYLGGLADAATGLYDLTFLESADAQDLVTANLIVTSNGAAPIPLPASSLLLLGSLGGLIAARKRAKRV